MGKVLENWRVTEGEKPGYFYAILCFQKHLLQLLPLLLGSISDRTAPSSLISAPLGPSDYRMPQLLALAKLPSLVIPPAKGSSCFLLLPASGLLPHFLLASQLFHHWGSQFPLLNSLCLKDP